MSEQQDTPKPARELYSTPARKVLNDYLRWSKHRWVYGNAWMARTLCVSRAAVAAWRSGASLPSAPNAFALERLTGIKASWWITEHDLATQARAEAEAFRLSRLPPVVRKAGPSVDWVLPGQLALFSGQTKTVPQMPAEVQTSPEEHAPPP